MHPAEISRNAVILQSLCATLSVTGLFRTLQMPSNKAFHEATWRNTGTVDLIIVSPAGRKFIRLRRDFSAVGRQFVAAQPEHQKTGSITSTQTFQGNRHENTSLKLQTWGLERKVHKSAHEPSSLTWPRKFTQPRRHTPLLQQPRVKTPHLGVTGYEQCKKATQHVGIAHQLASLCRHRWARPARRWRQD